MLGTALLFGYPKAARYVIPLIWILSGLGVWLFARSSLHFGASGLTDMIERLEKLDVPVRHRKVPDLGLHQVFLHDPNGVMIELNYAAEEGRGIEAD